MNSKTSYFGVDSVYDIARVAVIAALYVVITMVLAAFSFGPVQVRLAEMLNLLAIYNKRYVLAVPIGVALANLSSPYGVVDIVWGSLSTFATMLVFYYVAKSCLILFPS
ncbi:QueT transporter family protein [Secundilactobacillus odoratitofui]|uniref:QueT transporter family protein n=1 Tax=Secundilactobacillus odoratitofui TaxID=480930 RepID=UPI000B0E44D8|nr:QueT transporter family protein [Secundilactobacillus odoratitofui]